MTRVFPPNRNTDFRDSRHVLEEEKTVKLLCGHRTRGVSIVTYPNGRKAYQCPEGCGIQKASTRQN